jgi:hypothetical protein
MNALKTFHNENIYYLMIESTNADEHAMKSF